MINDNEIYPDDSSLVINNYALGYQDYFGFRGVAPKTEPLAPENELYMSGWFAARLYELEESKAKTSAKVRKPQGYNALENEWRKLAKENGWSSRFPI